jgi:hypothetical protein
MLVLWVEDPSAKMGVCWVRWVGKWQEAVQLAVRWKTRDSRG